MKLKTHSFYFVTVLLMRLAGQTQAGSLIFTIDPTQSEISLSGKVAGVTFTPQGLGSLTNFYSGFINADVANSTIQFTGSSVIMANTNGIWQPAIGSGSGSAPADYGAKVTISPFTGYGAARTVLLDLNSPLLSLNGTNFDSTALIFSFATNAASSFDYNAVFSSGTLSLTGNSTNAVAEGATITTNGNVIKLVIKIDAQFSFTIATDGDTPLNLSGQIVSTNLIRLPFIRSIAIKDNTVTLRVEEYSQTPSQLEISSNLVTWKPASFTSVVIAGVRYFTTPLAGSPAFYRIKQ